MYATYSDKQLVSLLQNDDERAFREIYDRYWKKLLFKASQKIGEVSLAEEAIQDIFLSLWTRRHDLVLQGELGAYLAAATTYSVIKCRQKRKRERQLHLASKQFVPHSENTTENMLAFEALQHRILQLVAALPEQTRLIYKLHKEEGCSYKEIATSLDISPKTVDYHLSKAIKTLRAALSLLVVFLFSSFF